MAYIKNIKIKKTVQNCINYITDPNKTQDGELVSYGGTVPECANMIWEGVRKKYGKDNQIKAHHFVQSFDPKHEITPEEAQRIGTELAEMQFRKYGFEYIVATHVDSGVIHNHILVNSVSSTTGRKYQHNNSRDFKKNPNSYIRLRQLNIDVCRKYGIPAVDMPKLDEWKREDEKEITITKRYSDSPGYSRTKAYDSWTEKELTNKRKIRVDIDEAVMASSSWDEYLDVMKKKGYEIKWQTKSGEARKYITYVMEGAQRGRRDVSLNFRGKNGEIVDRYSRYAIEKRIQKIQNTEKTVLVKTVKIEYKKVVVKGDFMFRGYYMDGAKYFCHPKYRIIRKNGRTYYVKRGFLETWYIKYFLKMPEKLVRVNGKYGNLSGRLSLEEERKIREEVAKTVRRCGLISQYGIHSADDAEKVRLRFAVRYQNILSQIEDKKRRIQENDRYNSLADILESLGPIGEEYASLTEGKEKADFYFRHKYEIQKLNFARRELSRGNYSIEELWPIREERSRLYAEMKALVNQQEEYMLKISDMEKIKDQVKGIHIGTKQKEDEKESGILK